MLVVPLVLAKYLHSEQEKFGIAMVVGGRRHSRCHLFIHSNDTWSFLSLSLSPCAMPISYPPHVCIKIAVPQCCARLKGVQLTTIFAPTLLDKHFVCECTFESAAE